MKKNLLLLLTIMQIGFVSAQNLKLNEHEEQEDEKFEEGKQDLKRKLWGLPTKEEMETLDLMGYYQAMDFVDKKIQEKKFFRSAAPDYKWESRGPNNRAGRIQKIAFDPNDPTNKKAWAGSSTGGLWYNNDVTDPLSSWNYVSEMWSTFSITAIAFDPTNPQIMFVGTSGALYKSTNDGQTWTKIVPVGAPANTAQAHDIPLSIGRITDILIVSSTEMYASTGIGLCKSVDGGTTWSRILLPIAPNNFPAGFKTALGGTFNIVPTANATAAMTIKKASDGKLFTNFANGQIFKSNDGITWTNISPPQMPVDGANSLIALAPSTSGATQVLYTFTAQAAGGGWLKKSVDAGVTWTNITWNGGFQQFYDNFVLKVHPTDDKIFFAATIGMQKSLDGGATWKSYGTITSPVASADWHDIQFAPNDPSKAIISNDQGISYWKDIQTLTATGEARFKNLVACQAYFTDMRNVAGDNTLACGAQDQPSQLMNSAGLGSSVNLSVGEGYWLTFDKNEPNILLYTGFPSTFLHIQNVSTGQKTTPPISDFGQFSSAARAYNSDLNIAIAYRGTSPTVPGRIIFDKVSNISTTFNASNNVKSSFYIDGLFAADGVSNVTDFGGIKSMVFGKDPNVLFLQGYVEGVGKAVIYKVTNPFSATPIVKRINVGQVWADLGSALAIGATDDELFVGGTNYYNFIETMFYTKDGGTTWKKMKNVTSNTTTLSGLPPAFGINSVIFNPLDYKQVFISSNSGVWTCRDVSAASPQWELASTDLARISCGNLSIRASDGVMSVGTFGRGVFTTNVNSCIDVSPTIQTQATNRTISVGQSAAFQIAATNVQSYAWEVSSNLGLAWLPILATDTTYTGATSPNLTLKYGNNTQNGLQYRCALMNGCAKAYSNVSTLTVQCPATTIVSQPQTITVYEGSSVPFQVNATNVLGYTWQISTDGTNFFNIALTDTSYTGQNTNRLTLKYPKRYQSNFRFRCNLTTCTPGGLLTNVAVLTVLCTPSTIQSQPANVTVMENKPATFTATANNVVGSAWQYSPNNGINYYLVSFSDTNFVGYNTNTLTVKRPTFAQNGYLFRYLITGCDNATVLSTPAILTVTRAVSTQDVNSIAVEIYPNPANDFINLKLPFDKFEVSILDARGAVVKTVLNEKNISIKDLPSNSYFVKIKTDKGISTQSFIISR
jgi:photosystem II stability/assembly factor-like uncharacterized protein